jgi:diacylglycerol kinase family enzyme
MKSFLFINHLSGSYNERRAAEIVRRLGAAGHGSQVFNVTTPAEVRRCCQAIYAVEERPLIVVAAGDGTVNAVINCLVPGTATIAILPLGTSNVLAAELGISSLRDGLERIERGESRPLAVGEIALTGGRHRFALMAGIGFDGAVVKGVRPKEKRLLKQGAYALSALRNSLAWDNGTIEVVTPTATAVCHTVVVCNASRYGGDFVLAAKGNIATPGFTAVCVTGTDRRSFAGAAWALFRGRVATSRYLRQITSAELEIRGAKPIQIDGDYLGTGPARITAVGEFARIIV